MRRAKQLGQAISSHIESNNPIVVEAGHYYTNSGNLPLESRQGAKIGRRLVKALRDAGREVVPEIFEDDFHGTKGPHVKRLRKQVRKTGFHPQKTRREDDMVPKAEEMIRELNDAGKTRKGGERLRKSGLRLKGSDGKPTCAVLDAALMVERHGEHQGHQVIVLPESYKSEQRAAREVLSEMNKTVPVTTVYHDKEGKVTGVER